MRLSQHEIRKRAVEFADKWKGETRERAESQSFWNDFFFVFGIERRTVGSFDESVIKSDGRGGFIDLLWRGKLLVEHKSHGADLAKAFTQAKEYFPGIPESDHPQYVLVSDFARFRLYNLEMRTHVEFQLDELYRNIDLFGFITGFETRVYREEDEVNIKVARQMGDLHQALWDSNYRGHDLEVFLSRIIFCLFADDTGALKTKGDFKRIVRNRTREDGWDMGDVLSSVFTILNTPEVQRQKTEDEDFLVLEYINGNLFSERLTPPRFDRAMRQIVLECCSYDWSHVSPAIFGSLFESVMHLEDRESRRAFGAYYTSEKNIRKLVEGLFLDELRSEFRSKKRNLKQLREFRQKLGSIRLFDPACGCGSFLVVAYRELRRLETEVLLQFREQTNGDQFEISSEHASSIDVDCCYGIELNEFPVEIAKVALWITDHMMNMELSAAIGEYYVRLPLEKAPNIHRTNALRINWSDVLPRSENVFVLGNPPFRGRQFRTDEQRQDMELVFSNRVRGYGVLDYVAA